MSNDKRRVHNRGSDVFNRVTQTSLCSVIGRWPPGGEVRKHHSNEHVADVDKKPPQKTGFPCTHRKSRAGSWRLEVMGADGQSQPRCTAIPHPPPRSRSAGTSSPLRRWWFGLNQHCSEYLCVQSEMPLTGRNLPAVGLFPPAGGGPFGPSPGA